MTTETQSAFAARLGVNRSTVTRWHQAGRVVLDAAGRVVVDASLALLEDTRGNRDDVAARHAAQRAAAPAQEAEEPPADEPQGAKAELRAAAIRKALAESRRVQAQADQEEMRRDEMAGNLIPREAVDNALRHVGAALGALLAVYPDQVAPIVAPVADLAEVHRHLVEACRNLQAQFADEIARRAAALAPGDVQ